MYFLLVSLLRRADVSFRLLHGETAHRLMREAAHSYDTLGLSRRLLSGGVGQSSSRAGSTDRRSLSAGRPLWSGQGALPSRRAAVWPVFATYAQAVAASGQEEWRALFRRVRQLIEAGHIRLPFQYRAVIVDEAQDMGTPEMRLLLALVEPGPNSLLLLGDTRQQIYARGSFVPILGLSIGRRHHQLRLNYRTTEQISTAASSLLTSAHALNGEDLQVDDSFSLLKGPRPTVRVFASPAEEQAAVVAAIQEALVGLRKEEIVLMAAIRCVAQYLCSLPAVGRHRKLQDRCAHRGWRGRALGDDTSRQRMGVSRSISCLVAPADSLTQFFVGNNDAARAEQDERERRLLYVAMTRARELLWISGSGIISPFLKNV